MTSAEPPIHYNYPMFEEQISPKGCLTQAPACHAAWYYYALAHKIWAQDKDGEFGLLEGSPYLDPKYEQLAWSVTTMYGLTSPDDFMLFMPLVKLETDRLGMMNPQQKYLNPRRLL